MKNSLRYKLGIHEIIGIIVGILGFIIFDVVNDKYCIDKFFISNCIRCVWLAAISALCGPVVGVIVGFAGSQGQVLYNGDVAWFVYSLGMSIYGLFIGRYAPKYGAREGLFIKEKIMLFNLIQSLASIIVFVFFIPLVLFLLLKGNLYELIRIGCENAVSSVLFVGVFLTIIFNLYTRSRAKYIKS